MQVTEHIHALEIPFTIPVSPEKRLARIVYSYLVFHDTITLIDSGVSGADAIIFSAIRNNGRDPGKISRLILSHSHPDHLGAARTIQEKTGCLVWAHMNERPWIEDTEKQFTDRPVPGFHSLVGGPVGVDRLLEDGERLEFDTGLACTVVHTPGHSSGSISLLFDKEKTLFTGDALPLPMDLPIYEDIGDSLESIRKIQALPGVEIVLSSWEPPIHGQEKIHQRIAKSVSYLQKIHTAVLAGKESGVEESMALCKQVVSALGLSPVAVNPLVAKAFASSLAAEKNEPLRFDLNP